MVPVHSISPSSHSRKGAQVTTVQFLQLPLSPGSPLGARMERPDLLLPETLLPLRSQSIFLTTFWSRLSPSQALPFLDSFHTCSGSPLYISLHCHLLTGRLRRMPPEHSTACSHLPTATSSQPGGQADGESWPPLLYLLPPTCQCLTEPPKSFKAVAPSLAFGPLPTQFIGSVPFLTMGLLWS